MQVAQTFAENRLGKRLLMDETFYTAQKSKKNPPPMAWFLPELTAHCGPAPDRQKSDRPHPSCSCSASCGLPPFL